MASTIELFGAICFILTQLFLLSRVQGAVIISCNNATNHGSSWPSGQLNRSLADEMPQKLYIQIEYETLKTENLVFFKTDQNVANSHLPVDAPANYSFRDKVMEDIGEFVMYQDSTRSSAIVYFGKLKAIYGVYGTDYYIQGYPLELDHQNCTLGIVKSPYVVKRVGMPFQLGPNVVPANTHMNQGAHQMDQNNEQVMNPKPSPSTRHDRIQENSCRMSDEKDIEYNKDQITIPYYLETLVFISKGVTDIYCNVFKDNCINEIVRHYLVYFNAVDLLFQKLNFSKVNIHINIARIVIEDETLMPFDFINQGEIHFTELRSKLPAYLKKYSSSYPPDSFDHVFIVTEHPIKFETTLKHALTKSGDDLISARANGKFYEAVPVTVIRAENYYSGYYHAAEEIAQVLSPDIDPLEHEESLVWSQNSLNQFEVFFSENSNRVFLRNRPRSLLSPGPYVLTSPQAQCKCFGTDNYKNRYYYSAAVVRGCLKPLECSIESTNETATISLWPLDGTPCGKITVCWAGRCVRRADGWMLYKNSEMWYTKYGIKFCE